MPLPLTMIADIARATPPTSKGWTAARCRSFCRKKPGEAIVVRFGGISPMGTMPGMTAEARGEGRRRREGACARRAARARGLQIFIDPVSGEVLGTRKAVLPPFLIFAHQLHGNFLMGREAGRPIVGWLGVAMCLLGLSGLVLWWPKRGQWKYAFKVRRTATGLRFHRELHAATGIWIFLVFMAVSFSGVVIAWPQTIGMLNGRPRDAAHGRAAGRQALGATEAVIAAQRAVPGLQPRSITIPARPDQPISVSYLSHGAINATGLCRSL